MSDPINHPPHYGGGSNPYETIKKIASKGIDYLRGFCLGCVEKYIDRAGKKEGEDELKDLKKARWYLDFFISYLESKGEVVDAPHSKNTSDTWLVTEHQPPPVGELVVGLWVVDGKHPMSDGLQATQTNWWGTFKDAPGIALIIKRSDTGEWGTGIKNPPKYWTRLPRETWNMK